MKMKKISFLQFVLIVVMAMVILFYFFFNFEKEDFKETRFIVKNNQIFDVLKNSPFKIKGIVYSPYYPGETGGENLPNDDRYFSHLKKMKNMGVNSISLFPQKMPTNFFKALDDEDLFYAQIININLYDGTDSSDLLNSNYQSKVSEYIKEIIDYNYQEGRPERLLYFALGYEINPGYLYLTNTLNRQIINYQGKFLNISNRYPVEIALAKLLDMAKDYEQEKYGRTSLYAHISFPAYSILDKEVSVHNLKTSSSSTPFDFFDIFAINIYPSYFYNSSDNLEFDENNSSFSGYVQNLLEKIDKPLIITELGLSSAGEIKYPSVPAYKDNSQEAVADLYMRANKDILEASAKALKNSAGRDNFSGFFFFEFMDEYWKNGEEENDSLQQNPNDPEEWYGIFSIKDGGSGFYKIEPKQVILEAVLNIFK